MGSGKEEEEDEEEERSLEGRKRQSGPGKTRDTGAPELWGVGRMRRRRKRRKRRKHKSGRKTERDNLDPVRQETHERRN